MAAAKRSGTRPSEMMGVDDPEAALAWDLVLETMERRDRAHRLDMITKRNSKAMLFPVYDPLGEV